MQSSLLTDHSSTKHSPAQNVADDLVDLLLKQIMELCGESCVTRRNSVSGSIEWHKCNGEILAYSRLTHFVEQLNSASGTRDRHSSGNQDPQNFVSRRGLQDSF